MRTVSAFMSEVPRGESLGGEGAGEVGGDGWGGKVLEIFFSNLCGQKG